MSEVFDQDIKYLPGVGPRRRDILAKDLNITTWGQLLEYFPYKYIDRSRVYSIRELTGDMPFVQIMGRIVSFEEFATGVRQKRIVAHFTDGTGMVDIVWFRGGQYIYQQYKINEEYVVFGRPTVFNGRYQFAHPDIDKASDLNLSQMGLQPYYSTTERMKKNGMNSHSVEKTIRTLLTRIPRPLQETLPPFITGPLHLMSRDTAMRAIHYPRNTEEMQRARQRLKFEELFYVQLNIVRYVSDRRRHYRGYVLRRAGDLLHTFFHDRLPFPLTGAQKRVIREIREDMRSGKQMNRLLQGDVGSGKTLVALLVALIVADNGYQSCIMAPTEVLAQQHYNTVSRFLAGTGAKCALLTGTTRKKERETLHKELAEGTVNILIGTHALIEESVAFKNLALAIVDEQHRFGVEQRSRLWNKSEVLPHILVMTATPIPRTLAMTLYGDLDVSVLDELPPGRKPVETIHATERQRRQIFAFMKEQIREGRQIFVVYPLIKESEKMDYKNLEEGYRAITEEFKAPEYVTAVVHGKQKPEDKAYDMKLFAEGRANILVATSVIEVGVDVPNASVMIIESAERFGLSQLHQLRGRVGRGDKKSYCILMTGYKLSRESRERIELMCSTQDGFELAEADLRMRGPGDLEGTVQSGLAIDLHIANLSKDSMILEDARQTALAVLENDPLLEKPENSLLRQQLQTLRRDGRQATDYSQIS